MVQKTFHSKKAAGKAKHCCPWRLNTQYPAALSRKLPDKDSAGPIRARGCRGRVCMRTVPRATRRGKPVRMPYFTIKFRHLSRIQQVFLDMLVPYKTNYQDKDRHNTFLLQQEGEYDTPYYNKTHPMSHVRHVLHLFISSIYVDIDDSNSDLSIITSRFRFLR